MIEVKKSVLVPYTAEQMFTLVSDIDNYYKYLPWCTKSEIQSKNNNEVIGAIYLEYLKIKMHFVTKNIHTPFSQIEMQLVDGPFHNLHGYWKFNPLINKCELENSDLHKQISKEVIERGCKVEFLLYYKFANTLLEKTIGAIFGFISKNIVDSFVKEAHIKYGRK